MAEITLQRLEQLRASARANRMETVEMLHKYDGAIETLTMLIDDLRSQTIKEAGELQAGDFMEKLVNNEIVTEDGQTVEFLGIHIHDNEDVAGVVMPEEE